MNEIRLWQGGI